MILMTNQTLRKETNSNMMETLKLFDTYNFKNGNLFIKDPTYTDPFQYTCSLKAKSGVYKCYAIYGDERECDNPYIPKGLLLIHMENALKKEEFEYIQEVAVDSAHIGVFNQDELINHIPNECWEAYEYEEDKNDSFTGAFEDGIFIRSGYGDGIYPLGVYKNKENEIYAIQIQFLDLNQNGIPMEVYTIPHENMNKKIHYDTESKAFKMDVIRSKKDLEKIVKEVKKDMDVFDIPYNDMYSVELYDKKTNAYGTCRYREHRITIHKNFFLCCPDLDHVRSVIAHELLHSAPCCYREGHKGKWKIYAKEFTEATKDYIHHYTIQRTGSMNLANYNNITKYGIYCQNCNKWIDVRYKRTSVIKNIDECFCPCCGAKALKVIDVTNKDIRELGL